MTILTDFLRLQLDFAGARAELAVSIFSRRLLDDLTPAANEPRPVMTVPGFLASETTLLRLNRYLCRHGYAAESWGLGRNLGPQDKNWSSEVKDLRIRVGDRVKRLADEHSAPVALIGQSLGGVYVRELALQMPNEIDRVIMLGAPTFHPYVNTGHNRVIQLFGYWMGRQSQAELAGRQGLLHWDATDPPLPCISIMSPVDAVVDEASAAIPDYVLRQSGPSAPRENLRVRSTHIGMGVNPFALFVIADRLAQDKEDWQTFAPCAAFPEALQWAIPLVYPKSPDVAQHPRVAELARGNR